MQHSPITDKSLGLITNYENKFADIRQRAKDEYIQRKKSHKKDKTVLIPEVCPEMIVVVSDYNGGSKNYYLCEVVDFTLTFQGSSFEYFGLLLKTTNKSQLSNIGRLITFHGTKTHWVFRKTLTKLKESEIKWIK